MMDHLRRCIRTPSYVLRVQLFTINRANQVLITWIILPNLDGVIYQAPLCLCYGSAQCDYKFVKPQVTMAYFFEIFSPGFFIGTMRIILIKNSGMHLKAPILARCMLSSTTSSRRHNQHSSGTLPEQLIYNSWPMLFLPSSALSSRMPNSGGSQLILGNAGVSPMAYLRRYRFDGHIIIQ